MRFLSLLLLLSVLAMPVSALELEAPPVPAAGREWMPHRSDSLWEGMQELLQKVVAAAGANLQEASGVSKGIFAAVFMVSLLQTLHSGIRTAAETAGTVAVASMLLRSTDSMISLAADTVLEIGEYGKLLLSVMTAGLAAQGGITGSAAMYAGTALFLSVLQSVMGAVLVPGVYLYLALCAGSSATGEGMLKRAGDLLKSCLSWLLKSILMIFTTYLGLTGVVSGTTDAAVLKATKVTMSSFIPVVGGVLSDASEAVLVSAGLLKNAAGVYGILAILALFLHPFLKIAAHYLVLKLTGALCSMIAGSRMTGIIDGFSGALGLLLGMTAAACVMMLISTVCFMKGLGG